MQVDSQDLSKRFDIRSKDKPESAEDTLADELMQDIETQEWDTADGSGKANSDDKAYTQKEHPYFNPVGGMELQWESATIEGVPRDGQQVDAKGDDGGATSAATTTFNSSSISVVIPITFEVNESGTITCGIIAGTSSNVIHLT